MRDVVIRWMEKHGHKVNVDSDQHVTVCYCMFRSGGMVTLKESYVNVYTGPKIDFGNHIVIHYNNPDFFSELMRLCTAIDVDVDETIK